MVETSRSTSYSGLLISFAGAALDFDSGYSYSMGSSSRSMTSVSPTSVVFYLLGLLLVFTGVLLVLPSMAAQMRRLGLVMEILGVVMALSSYFAPGMNLDLSFAMLIVAGAMILNGALMQRRMPTMGKE